MRILIFTIWIIVLNVSLVPLEMNAQWIPVDNGVINFTTLENDGNFLLAGTNSGFYISSDNGTNWIQRNNGLTNLSIYDLALSGNNLIAGTGSGVFLSTNQGQNWHLVSSNSLWNFAVNGSIINATAGFGTYRSIDSGNNWTLINENIFWECVHPWQPSIPSWIASIKAFDSILFAGSSKGGAAYSTNNGNTWTDISNGIIKFIPDPPAPVCFNYPTISGFTQIDSNLFIGASGDVHKGVTNGGIYTKPMNGNSWMQINNNLYNPYNTLTSRINSINSISGLLVVGSNDGIHMTTNNGIYWINKSQGLNPQSNVGQIHFKDNLVFILISGKIWKRNLAEMSSYHQNDIGTLAISSPLNGSLCYVDCDTGIFVYPKVTVTNFGSNNQSVPFEVSFEVKLENNVVFLSSVFDTISSGLTHEINFEPYYVPENTIGQYNLKTWTKLLSDDNKLNDTSKASFKVLNPNYSVNPALSVGYSFANSSNGASCAPSQPIYYWEDTTGSTPLILNGIPQIAISEGDPDNGYFVIQNVFLQNEQFNFFEDYSVNYFKISTNGIIGMGSNSVGISNSNPGPVPNYHTFAGPAFFPFWCDLDYSDQDNNGGNLKYKKIGNRLIITYDNVPLKDISYDPENFISFQVILEPKSGENGLLTVQFDYSRCGTSFLNKYYTNTLPSHTVGLQNFMGYNGIQYRYINTTGEIITPGPLFSSPLAVSFGADESVLPIELASFTSDVNGRNVTLNWQTSRESNNSGFDVERSNGDVQWSKVCFVPGNGNSIERKDYSFTDKNLEHGKYKYRLKQIDFNGSFKYFHLSSQININNPKEFFLSQNYPNPFNPVSRIDFALPVDSRVVLKIYDITGREIRTILNELRSAGYYTIDFDLSHLASGIYFYKLTAGRFSGIKRMVLIK